MAVTIKSSQEIELMRQAGKILAKVHEGLKKELKPGMSTLDIDRIGEEMIRSFVDMESVHICMRTRRSRITANSAGELS